MRIVKPLRLSILQRVITVNRAHRLSVGLCVYFPFEAPEVALPEIAMWQKVTKELGKDPLLDEGLPKPRGEALVAGKAFSPGGVPRPAFSARLEITAAEGASPGAPLVDKSLFVVGRRLWRRGVPTDPEPITEMPLVWEHAFGGPGFPQNPGGMGFAPVEQEPGGAKVHALPHIEDPRSLLKSPNDRPRPASFRALDPTWPQRMAKMGTYDAKWLETEFPGYARDMDADYFHAALEDQRLPGFFQGGEAIVMENLHPEKPRLTTTVTRLRARCFVTLKGSSDEELREVPTSLDTVILFPNIERGVAIFRGVCPIADDDAGDVTVMLAALESPDAPKPLEHYRTVLAQRLDKEKGHLYALRERDLLPEPDPGAPKLDDEVVSDMDELIRRERILERRSRARTTRELDRARMEMRILGLDPDEKLPKELPPEEEAPKLDELADYVEQAQAQAAELQADADVKRKDAEEAAREMCSLQGLDYDAIVEKAKREGGGPPKFRADAEVARMRDLAEVGRKAGAPMEELEAKIEDPGFVAGLRTLETSLLFAYRSFAHQLPPAQTPSEQAQAEARAEVARAIAAGEALSGRDLTGIDLSGMSFAKAVLREALLEGADLSACDLEGADLSGAVLARAKLGDAKLRGANLSGANLGEAEATGASFEGADLRKAVLHRTKLAGARLTEADLRGADFFESVVDGADFSGAEAGEVLFYQLDLSRARFTGTRLGKATFFQCKGEAIDFGGAFLEGTGLVEFHGEKASFRGARAAGLRLVSSTALPGADFTAADLAMASLRGADLAMAIFERASADGADFSESILRGARLASISAKGARFIRTDLTDADLTEANLMDALLQKATMSGARFDRANLFRASLLQAHGDDRTSFAGAHVARASFTRHAG